jgi:hypothetical protein
MELPVGELPSKGLRAWTQDGLKNHGLYKTSVPPQTGGTIIFQDANSANFAVEWDTGQTTIHGASDFAINLICIGSSHSLSDYLVKNSI